METDEGYCVLRSRMEVDKNIAISVEHLNLPVSLISNIKVNLGYSI